MSINFLFQLSRNGKSLKKVLIFNVAVSGNAEKIVRLHCTDFMLYLHVPVDVAYENSSFVSKMKYKIIPTKCQLSTTQGF